jgi:type II secretory pathway pseudopilin PulG
MANNGSKQWRSRRASQRGLSLVETLIVLVILAFGILSVVQLFPGGFFIIRSAENSASAARLGQNMIEALKQSGAGLPEGVYVGFLYSGTSTYGEDYFDPKVAPDDLNPYKPQFSLGPKYPKLYGDCNKARFISNETVAVPAPRGNGQMSSIYMLGFGPIVVGDYSNEDTIRPYLQVIGAPWTAKNGDSSPSPVRPGKVVDEPTEELRAGHPEFLVDYHAGMIAVPPASYVQFMDFTVSQGGVSYTLNLKIPPKGTGAAVAPTAAEYDGGWFQPGSASLMYEQNSPAVALPATTWDDGTAQVIRPFQYVNTLSGVTTYAQFANPPAGNPDLQDPYQYTLYEANIPGTVANIGFIGFNMAAARLRNTAPVTARISYSTLDWHIIHEDHDLASHGEATTVALALRHLKRLGDVENDSAMYNGLFAIVDTPLTSNKFDIYFVDRDTGAFDTGVYNLDEAVPPFSLSDIGVSYQSGHVRFPVSYTNAHQHVRVYYAAKDDWAVALQKAPSSYFHSMNGVNEDYDSMLKPTKAVNRYVFKSGSYQYVYFPLTDAGKEVRLDRVTYSVGPSGGPYTSVTKTMAMARISDETQDVAPGVKLPAIDLLKTFKDLAPSQPVKIESITGVSTKAQMIWRERGKWRRHTVDTMLLPPSAS